MAAPIGIRAEDKNRWERRAPLTPEHVRELIHAQGLAVRVEPSAKRAFPDRDYVDAGAVLDPALAGCRVVLGVKEIPPEKLEPGRAYAIFSHVVKGQPAGMPLLRRLLELGSTLLDYERIFDPKGRRVIFFGRHAGYAGMIDALWALGQRLVTEGALTPLEHVRLAHHYSGLDEALAHVARLGEDVRHLGLPPPRRPIVCGFTGSGHVTRGALEVFERLPVVDVDPEELLALPEDRDRPKNAFYRCVFERHHRYRRRDGGPFDAGELAARPEIYESGLGPFLPHLTMLVNGAYWEPPQPPLVTRRMLAELFAGERQPKLRVIADISCDVRGAIEATVRASDPGYPVYVYDPATGAAADGVEGRGVVVLAVDNLPAELPVEASHHFGDSLVRFVGALARADWDRPFAELDLPPELQSATIAHRGRLAPAYAYLENHLEAAL
jgi:Alanine dehydrogenase/PNT, N-terminal domain/Alanine dehydrogenase/PNT, C-terminal domain